MAVAAIDAGRGGAPPLDAPLDGGRPLRIPCLPLSRGRVLQATSRVEDDDALVAGKVPRRDEVGQCRIGCRSLRRRIDAGESREVALRPDDLVVADCHRRPAALAYGAEDEVVADGRGHTDPG